MAMKPECVRVCICVRVKLTGTSSYLPSYGGGGLVRPLGRGFIQHNGASAPSEASFGSSSLSYATASQTGRSGNWTAPSVGRGLAIGRGQYLLSQTGGIGNDFVLL